MERCRVEKTFLLFLAKKQIITGVCYHSLCLLLILKATILPVTNHFTTCSRVQTYRKINYNFALMFRLYGGGRSCARCHVDINPTDLVMKARHCVFHVDCFKCATCDNSLRKGEHPSLLNISLTLTLSVPR